MVDWLAPRQLASTGIKAVLSSIFGAYADKREVQAALYDMGKGEELYDGVYGETEESEDGFWLDYCADLGDGFNPTYSLAWLLSRKRLTVPGRDEPSKRGRLLVLGGDQVYPTANREQYQNRFVGPFRAALPWGPPTETPHLYAIPGNHDWYDGLTSFTRLFCQHRWVGGWKTRQRRSYFALRLPRGWWLWGTDIQLEADIDRPQLEYFRTVASQMQHEAEDSGDDPPRLILCTAEPTWVYCDTEPAGASSSERGGCRLPVEPERFASLDFFHREVIAPEGIRLSLILSGDLHHFTHYRLDPADPADPTDGDDGASGQPDHLVTCGGGGAYLYPTHHMPTRLAVPWTRRTKGGGVEEAPGLYERQSTFPETEDSRRLGRLSWFALPWRNWRFALLLAGVYLLFGWMLQSASKSGNQMFEGWWPDYARETGRVVVEGGPKAPESLLELLAELGPREAGAALHGLADVLRHSPFSVVFAFAVVFGLWQFRNAQAPAFARGVGGILHGVGHLVLGYGLIWIFSAVNLRVLTLGVDSLWHTLLFSVEILVAGGVLGGWLFGLYLMATSKISGAHINEVFSSQSLESYKGFVRLHIGKDGKLTLHPLGVPGVPAETAWRCRGVSEAKPGDPWLDPPEGGLEVTGLGSGPLEIS